MEAFVLTKKKYTLFFAVLNTVRCCLFIPRWLLLRSTPQAKEDAGAAASTLQAAVLTGEKKAAASIQADYEWVEAVKVANGTRFVFRGEVDSAGLFDVQGLFDSRYRPIYERHRGTTDSSALLSRHIRRTLFHSKPQRRYVRAPVLFLRIVRLDESCSLLFCDKQHITKSQMVRFDPQRRRNHRTLLVD